MDGPDEARLARIEAKMDALTQRLEDMVGTQVRDLGKRVRDAEADVRNLREEQARRDGETAGGRAVLAVILGIVSACGGVVGAVVSKLF